VDDDDRYPAEGGHAKVKCGHCGLDMKEVFE
jgi:hypothetical protein